MACLADGRPRSRAGAPAAPWASNRAPDQPIDDGLCLIAQQVLFLEFGDEGNPAHRAKDALHHFQSGHLPRVRTPQRAQTLRLRAGDSDSHDGQRGLRRLDDSSLAAPARRSTHQCRRHGDQHNPVPSLFQRHSRALIDSVGSDRWANGWESHAG